MSTYYEPQDVVTNGRKLNFGSHANMLRDIRLTGERLVMVGDRGIFKVAADVTDSSEYDFFHSTELLMSFISYRFYAYSPPVETPE